MDESVIRAIARWPDVPAVFGWLALNRRGQWLLRDSPLTHERAIGFINRNYASDERGRWFFQNGPQRVYVALELAPFVAHFVDDRLFSHVGEWLDHIDRVLIDEQGNVFLDRPGGAALLDDRDLLQFSEQLLDAAGQPAVDEVVEAMLEADGVELELGFRYAGRTVPIERIHGECVPGRLGFVRTPDEAPVAEARQDQPSDARS
ncbi:MAG: DUF2946 family protein [Gammaproteobacteria bacterium]|nr:DUF2946 family protein [Gammaproteobacteria bacterium]